MLQSHVTKWEEADHKFESSRTSDPKGIVQWLLLGKSISLLLISTAKTVLWQLRILHESSIHGELGGLWWRIPKRRGRYL